MNKSYTSKFRALRISSSSAVFSAMILQASSMGAAVAAVDPPSVTQTLAPGTSIVVKKTVGTPEIPPKPDIVFLADTTGSMGPAIANVKLNANTVMASVAAATTDPQFAAAEYRDVGDVPVFAVNQGLTANQADVSAGINTWDAAGGGDRPEAQLNALSQLANGAVTFRPGSTRIVAWFGDAPGHDPSLGATLASTIAALQAQKVSVIAINVATDAGINLTGQAAAITAAPPAGAGGSFFPSATPDQVSDAILAGLKLLPITVKPVPVGCSPLVITFDADSKTVTSGEDVKFDETIAVPNNSALAGQTVSCKVDFQSEGGEVIGSQDVKIEIPLAIDVTPDTASNELSTDQAHSVNALVTSVGSPLAGLTVKFDVLSGPNAGQTGSSATDASGNAPFSYTNPNVNPTGLGTDSIRGCVARADGGPDECDTVRKDWVDTIPPVTLCQASVNPAGNQPTAPGKGGQGQNQDGFYKLSATDNIWPADVLLASITLTDLGSGTVFGPPLDNNGDGQIIIKYTQAPDATPSIKAMGNGGAVDWHIIGKGDALATSKDGSGNTSTAGCLVPPSPK